jgi:hypothetical protein
MHIRSILLALLVATTTVFAADLLSNTELREVTSQDQAARSGSVGAIDWKVVSAQDAARRMQVAEILRKGEVKTSEDYYNAALVYQHGETADDIRLAYSLATVAVALDPENKAAKWLTAAAWDRIMMRVGQPQWYGTQYSKLNNSEAWQLYKMDETVVSDEERKRLGVPPLAESKSRAASIR